MSEHIVSIDYIEHKARQAFHAGYGADSCMFHPWTAAYTTWQAEYARCELEALAGELATSQSVTQTSNFQGA
ncbi:MAG: hypothetical protein V4633_13400 [Pseudomonadota bacterium]